VKRAVGVLRLRDLEITADLSGQKVIDLPVATNRGSTVRCAIYVNGVLTALSKKLATMLFQVPNKIISFMPPEAESFSRITFLPFIISPASVRLASRTSSTASLRLGPAFLKRRALGVCSGQLFDEGNVTLAHLFEHGSEFHHAGSY
jgi:hypothetical protein